MKNKLDFGGVEPGQIQLTFKPFRTDEVLALTGCSFAVYDHWLSLKVGDNPLLPLVFGDDADRTMGLNYWQTFAVFVGWKFIQEGAPRGRAEAMVRACQVMTEDYLRYGFDREETFYDVTTGVMVKAPATPLGQRLNLRTLYREFQSNVKRVFPEG